MLLIVAYDVRVTGLPPLHIAYYSMILWFILLPFLKEWLAVACYSLIGSLLLLTAVLAHSAQLSPMLMVHGVMASVSIAWMFVWLGVLILHRWQHVSMKSKEPMLLQYDYPSLEFINDMMMVLLFANAVALTLVVMSGFLLESWSWNVATLFSMVLWVLVLKGLFDYKKHRRGDRVSCQCMLYMGIIWCYLLSL